MGTKVILTVAGILGGIMIVSLLYSSKRNRNARIPLDDTDTLKGYSDISLDDLAKSYSKKIDQMILKEVKENEIDFVSGIFKISFSQEKQKIIVDADLYFQNPQKEWLTKNSKDLLKKSTLTSEGLKELIVSKEIKYELTAPKELEKYSV